MARLYHPPDPNSLASGQTNPTEQYAEKVIKLIPTEVIAAYISLAGLISLVKIENLVTPLYFINFIVCLIVTPLYLRKLSTPKKNNTIHLIISTVAFIVWAYNISGKTIVPLLYDAALSSIFLGFFSLICGLIPLE